MGKETISILLVEDNPADVEIIQRSLRKAGIHNPLHLARDGEEAIDFLHRRFAQFGVLILDIHLPKIGGMEVLKEAKRIDPELVVIMLTGQASLRTAVESLRREGAFDYLQKSKDGLSELVDTVRLAVEKRALRLQARWVFQADGAERIIDMTTVQERFGLSEREIDLVKCLCRGDSNKETAEQLFLSETTIKGYLKHIYRKMGIHSRSSLVSRILVGAAMRNDLPSR